MPDRLPDFFVLGVAKGGTTSLHYYLRQHPALFLPYVKELQFFDRPEDDPGDLDAYLEYFSGAGDRLTGEATPSYFRHAGRVTRRMRRLYGDAPPRFLLLLRDPVERAYSHYLHNVAEGREPLSFEEALAAEQAAPDAKQADWKGYFQDGCYADTLERWFDAFPPERFFIRPSAALRRRTDATLRAVFDFLGVDPSVEIDTDTSLNQTGEQQSRWLGTLLARLPGGLPDRVRQWIPRPVRLTVEQFIRRRSTGTDADRPTLDPALGRELRHRYVPHVERLEALLNRDLSDWRPEAANSHRSSE